MNKVQETNSTRSLLYKAIILSMRLLGIATLAILIISLLPLAIPYFKKVLPVEFVDTALNIEKSLFLFVQKITPMENVGKGLTRLIVVVVAFTLNRLFARLQERYETKVAKLQVKKDYETWKAEMHLSDDAKVLTPLKEKLESLQPARKTDRDELLKLFAETKKKLDAMGRDLAFLSIDVVDSTGLKGGEEKAAIEFDFKEYKNFVEGKLMANGSLKSTWTPDGVMSCFPTVDAAVRAAREVINGLEAFNRNVKTMRKDFRVRCGVNAGYVYFDESLPLEEMSDRVIDVAGHMQKQAHPNTICIAKPAIEPMQERDGFSAAGKFVDGYEIYMWGKE